MSFFPSDHPFPAHLYSASRRLLFLPLYLESLGFRGPHPAASLIPPDFPERLSALSSRALHNLWLKCPFYYPPMNTNAAKLGGGWRGGMCPVF